MLCPDCASRISSVLAIRSAFRFEGAAKSAIHELKYHNVRALAPTLAHYVSPLLQNVGFEPDIVLPVPMHRSRLRKRGYNQAALLARAVADELELPIHFGSLARTGAAVSQVSSSGGEARWRNVESAFMCTNGTVSDKRVLLVDDVCTTGATIEACGRALRTAGATEIVAVTVAREV